MHGIIDELLLNATAVSDFKPHLCDYVRSAPRHRKTYSHFPKKERCHKSQKLHDKYSLTLDDLQQNALPGIPVPQ